MKRLRMAGILLLGVGVLMALIAPGTVSATELTCGAAMCPTGTTIDLESEGHATFDSPIGKLQCDLSIEGATANTGGASETIAVSISKPSFTGCTTAVIQVLANGNLSIHTQETNANNNGTVIWTGAEWTVETFGEHCIYKTTETDIGTLTGTANTSGNATLDISATIPRTSGRSGALCGPSEPWTGAFKVTAPESLNID